MNIRDVHLALAEILTGLAITEPATMEITRVWPFIPPANQAIVERTIVLWYDLTRVAFGTNGLVVQEYDIHMNLFGARAEVDVNKGAEIASAFLDALVTLLSSKTRAGGVVDVIRDLRGAEPGQGTMARLSWGNVPFIGLNLVIPITLTDTRERGA